MENPWHEEIDGKLKLDKETIDELLTVLITLCKVLKKINLE